MGCFQSSIDTKSYGYVIKFWYRNCHGSKKHDPLTCYKPLDLTTNASFKKFEKRAFSDYFTSCIMEALENDPNRDVTTIKVDLRMPTLKPRHAKVMADMYTYLKSEKGNRIIEALRVAREGNENVINLNPFV